ncbi:hypothetical protein HUJ04_001623 [Dendroctonus ponderosae]
MAGPTKKPKNSEEAPVESGDESMSEDSDSGSYHGQQVVQATFEGRNPEGHDFHGIKLLLSQLFLGAEIDLGQMADMLIAQTGVGSVLKQSDLDSDEEDDAELVDQAEVYGITSVINLTSHKETPCVVEFYSILDQLIAKHASDEVQQGFKKILHGRNKLGFLINERFVNIPSKISAAMFNSLYDELQRIQKKDKSYAFDYLVFICKTSKPKGETDAEEQFSNDEEEVFRKAADVTFDFSVADQCDTGLEGRWLSADKQSIPFRRIMLINYSKLKDVIDEITILVQ